MKLMKDATYTLLTEMLEDALQQIKPVLIHLEHQFDLVPEERVTELTEDELGEQIRNLRLDRFKIGEALHDLKQHGNENTPVDQHPGAY